MASREAQSAGRWDFAELPQNRATRCVDDADRASRTDSLENIWNNRAIARATSQPVAVGMISPRAGRVAVDDLQTTRPVPNLHHVIVRAQRNGEPAVLLPGGRDRNNMRGRLADRDAVENGSAGRSILLIHLPNQLPL